MNRFFAKALALAALSLLLVFSASAEDTLIGTKMTDFSYTTVAGEDITLSGLLEQYDAVYVNFYFNGCFWCGLEFPALETAWEAHKDHIAVVAISPFDDPDEIAEYAGKRDLKFNFVSDETSGIVDTYCNGYPTSLLINKEGVICWMPPLTVTNPAVYDAAFTACAEKTPAELVGYEPPELETIHPAVDPAVLTAALGGDGAFSWESGGTDLISAFSAGAANEGVSFATGAKENAMATLTGVFSASAGDTVTFRAVKHSDEYDDFSGALGYAIYNDEDMSDIVVNENFEEGDHSYSVTIPRDGTYVLYFAVQTIQLESSLTLSDIRLTHAN